ncbi:hypothetical protein [Cellulomonas persica]|uniref:Transcriptional regulator, AbiEi antitoxin, Type IV TA system n=1 Tax=Cellulomonas persica TaxID=76861 RepID=A0A510USP2_9CELL|nr:hypothetical protein [Cellulomonas persica]GEK17697.1 hypothetical protein CPE01_14300 [Cellulomonas persica]
MRALTGQAREVIVRQDGVATVEQLVAWGFSSSAVRRKVAAGHWRRAFRGVVVLQSGPTSWRQRARAALLYAGPTAALSHESAAFHHGVLRDPGHAVVVTVPHSRTVMPQPGLVVHRTRNMPWAGGRLRSVEPAEAILDVLATTATAHPHTDAGAGARVRDVTDAVVGLLCDAVRAGIQPDDLLVRAARRPRMAGRRLLVEMLGQVAQGVESPLEHRYARDVERRHGLPRAVAQRWERVDGRWIRADRVYVGFGVRAELDGRLAHPFGATDDDVWRDNATLLASGDTTLRYRWRHVAVTPCATAAQVARALRDRGWPDHPRRCGRTCAIQS